MDFQSGSKGIKGICCKVPYVKWERTPDRRTKIGEGTITFCVALLEWDFTEADVGTGAKVDQ